jgi:hypothetical protein
LFPLDLLPGNLKREIEALDPQAIQSGNALVRQGHRNDAQMLVITDNLMREYPGHKLIFEQSANSGY